MPTRAETYSYRQFKSALDAQYDIALANLAIDGVHSAGWIRVDDIHKAYENVWGTISYDTAYKTQRVVGGLERLAKDQWLERTNSYVAKNLDKRIKDVWAYSKKLYVESIDDAVRTAALEGLGTEQAARRIRTLVNKKLKGDINAWRARRIARTELTAAGNYGSYQGLVDAVGQGARLRKRWTISGRNTRDTHLAAEGQVRDVDQYFDVGGCKLLYPGDPTCGVAAEVINCMCSSLPVENKGIGQINIKDGILEFVA